MKQKLTCPECGQEFEASALRRKASCPACGNVSVAAECGGKPALKWMAPAAAVCVAAVLGAALYAAVRHGAGDGAETAGAPGAAAPGAPQEYQADMQAPDGVAEWVASKEEPGTAEISAAEDPGAADSGAGYAEGFPEGILPVEPAHGPGREGPACLIETSVPLSVYPKFADEECMNGLMTGYAYNYFNDGIGDAE